MTDLNTSLNCSLFSTFSMRKPNEPRGLLSLRRTSLQTFDLWDVDQPLEFSFWFAICFFNDAKVPPFIFCNCCLLVDSFLCWLKFFLQACCLPRMFFFVSSPLKGEVSLFFETFYFCRLVAYPIIISLFTFTVPSVWDHFFCVSMSTTRTSLLIFSWVLQCHLISSSFAFLRNCLWSIGLCLKTYVSSYLKHKRSFPWFFAILSKLPAAG